MPNQTIFPAINDPSRRDVAAWLSFYAGPYSTFSRNRTPASIMNNAHTIITLPYPGIFNTQNHQDYSNMPSPQIRSLEMGVFGTLQQSILGTIERAESFINGTGIMTFDHMESVLTPGGRRSHKFEFNLIAKTEESAGQAVNAALEFQTLMHPGANTVSIYNQTHPALWVIVATSTVPAAGSASYSNDRGGLDGFALTSVLTDVDINRAPIENIPYVIKSNSAEAYWPIATNIKLSFIELEPAFSDPREGRVLINRSQKFT